MNRLISLVRFSLCYRHQLQKPLQRWRPPVGPSRLRTLRPLHQRIALGTSSHIRLGVDGADLFLFSVECTICGDRLHDVALQFSAPCRHYQCHTCLISLVETCTRDESLYPLRCCQQRIPLNTVFPRLRSSLRSRFRRKAIEYDTPPNARVYCPKPSCSTFIGPISTSPTSSCEQDHLECPQCETSICSSCRNEAHGTSSCPESLAVQAVKDLAATEGWQTCPACHSIVELAFGCNHMTCRCGAHFCYVCAATWKTCQCAQWDESRLLDAAQRRVEVEAGGREGRVGLAPDVFRERVRVQAEQLRVNHECDPHVWRYRHGGGMCEQCNYNLPMFLMVSSRWSRPGLWRC